MTKTSIKRTIAVAVGTKPKTKAKPHEIGKTHPTPEKKDDVAGQGWGCQIMQCWQCGGLMYIWGNIGAYRCYECLYCGAQNCPERSPN